MALEFQNNYSTTLLSAALSTDTVLSLAAVPSNLSTHNHGEAMYLTIMDDAAAPTAMEVIIISDSAGGNNTVTAIRGRDGTAAQAWPAGSVVEARVNAEILRGMAYVPNYVTFLGPLSTPNPALVLVTSRDNVIIFGTNSHNYNGADITVNVPFIDRHTGYQQPNALIPKNDCSFPYSVVKLYITSLSPANLPSGTSFFTFITQSSTGTVFTDTFITWKTAKPTTADLAQGDIEVTLILAQVFSVASKRATYRGSWRHL